MHECHWFCNNTNGQTIFDRCMECLSWRGQHCFQCFEL
ncbi:unnamed protein product [Enterobius vermicularis]|uniref:Zn_Tnp_IS91 domain-containing protein n=1 Tax=Enterobius vermicularis TaxID=51028 RepID=A0A0N4UZT5_ENTVE|nr:unnamed protein product [Enterobius vermicularis]